MVASNVLVAAFVGLAAAHAGHNHGEKYQQKKFVGETKADREYGPDCARLGPNTDLEKSMPNGAKM